MMSLLKLTVLFLFICFVVLFAVWVTHFTCVVSLDDMDLSKRIMTPSLPSFSVRMWLLSVLMPVL